MLHLLGNLSVLSLGFAVAHGAVIPQLSGDYGVQPDSAVCTELQQGMRNNEINGLRKVFAGAVCPSLVDQVNPLTFTDAINQTDNTQLVNMITNELEQFSFLVYQSHQEVVNGNLLRSSDDQHSPVIRTDSQITSPEPDSGNTPVSSTNPYVMYGDTYYVIPNHNTVEPLTPKRNINPTRTWLDINQASGVELLTRSPLLFLIRYTRFDEAENFLYLLERRTKEFEFFAPVDQVLKPYVDALPMYFTQVGVSSDQPQLAYLSILGMNLANAMRDVFFPIYQAGLLHWGNEDNIKRHVKNLIDKGQNPSLLPSLYESSKQISQRHEKVVKRVVKAVTSKELKYSSEMIDEILLLGPSSQQFDITDRVLHFDDTTFSYAVIDVNGTNE